MSFDKTALSNYVELKSKEISSKTVSESKTAKLLISTNNVQVGVKGSAPILKADSDTVFQDGSTCGRVASGDVKLADKQITVKIIADKQNLCPKTLINTYYSWVIGSGSEPEGQAVEAAFASYIMDLRSAKIQEQNEQLLWKGDTALTGSNNLKFINGILKQVASLAININSTKTTLIEKLQDSFLKMPVKISAKDDFRIFIGEDMFAQYLVELANKNIYKDQDDYKLFGTNATLIAVPGLNGTNKVFMTRLSNLQLGVDGTSEDEKATLKYSMETEQFYQDFFWSIGISVIYEDESGLADYTPSEG